jgi:serine/threonine-protein kinase
MSAKTATVYEPGYTILGKYQLESLLGQGGMGAVWRARNVGLDSPVALKVVRGGGGRDAALLRGRLVQEARAAAKLTHPAIVKVFDVGQTEAGDPFIVMELLHGESLGKILEAEGRLAPPQAVGLLLPICDALWLAHSKGIVHRDLKPDNVFVVQHEGNVQPTLLDFGIVKLPDAEGEQNLTKAGDVLGSPDYMSPEQARGLDNVSHLSDLWSFSVVLYETIAGRTPFKGSNYNALLRQIVEDTPPTLKELGAGDDDLSAIIARGLSKNPSDRFGDMGELGRALAAWLVRQGVTQDICGTTLETKWLRSESQRRVGRPSLVSMNEWTAEGSGVRRNNEAGANTLPAQLRATPEAGLASEREASAPPTSRPKWVFVAAGAVMLLATLILLLTGRSKPTPVESAAATHTGAESIPTAPSPATAPPTPSLNEGAPVPSVAPGGDPSGTPAQATPEPVSSKVGRASPKTARGVKAASGSRPTQGGKPKGKSGDLMTPY